jgi:hypothetical protein
MPDNQTIILPMRTQRTMSIKNLIPRLPERGRIAIGMKGEMMLAMVRVNVKTKNTTQAKAFADKLNKEQPGTRAAQEAQKLISKS